MSTDLINGYNDPNWIEEALVRCASFTSPYARIFKCGRCCNYNICEVLREQERERKRKEAEEKKVTQVIYDESHLVWDDTLDRSRMYITSRESTPSPMSYRVSEYLRTYYGTAVGADNND
jgi:hypothetical protein